MVKKYLVATLILLSSFLPLGCVPKPANASKGYTNASQGERESRRAFTSYIEQRTVQVKLDCEPKKGVVVVGSDDPSSDRDGRGSGTIVNSGPDGSYIFTAAHVIELTDKKEYAGFDCQYSINLDSKKDSRYIEASIVAANTKEDIAVLKVDEDLGIDTDIELNPLLGELVFAAGYPAQVGNYSYIGISITEGTLATLDVYVHSQGIYHRTTAQVYFGSSGGGLWTEEGKLVGIVSMFYAGSSGEPIEGYYYVKPVKEVVSLLKKEGKYNDVYKGRD